MLLLLVSLRITAWSLTGLDSIKSLQDKYAKTKDSFVVPKLSTKLTLTFFVIILGLLVHLMCSVGVERGLCLKKGKLFNLVFTFGVIFLGISIQSLGLSAEALKVVATSYCANSFDLLANESYTIDFLPEEMKGFARQCFYYTGSGDLASLQTDKISEINYNTVLRFLSIISKAQGYINLSPKVATRVSQMFDYLNKVEEMRHDILSDFKNNPSAKKTYEELISKLNLIVSCTGKQLNRFA